MVVYLEEIENGAEYEGVLFDFWISAKLSSGKTIKVFDSIPIDARGREKETVECLIVAGFINIAVAQEPPKDTLKGVFIGEYHVSPDWETLRSDMSCKSWFGLQIEDGVFLLDPEEISGWDVLPNQIIELCVGRYDLVAIR